MKTRLRVLRAELEWSQAELAMHVGVSRACINSIETGRYDPSLPLAFKIARVFGKNSRRGLPLSRWHGSKFQQFSNLTEARRCTSTHSCGFSIRSAATFDMGLSFFGNLAYVGIPCSNSLGVDFMARGFESFELDDFRDSQWQPEPSGHRRKSSRGRGSGSQPETSVRMKLAKLRETEYLSDHLEWQSRERQEVAPLSGDTRQTDLLEQRERTAIQNRDRSYSLRPSEIHALTEVGKFRVVTVEDLAKHAYAGDRSRLDSDLRNLIHQRLVARRDTSVLKKESRQVLTLTKEGKRLIRRHGFVLDDQAIYSGFVKPKEADHDATLYRLYQKAADEIERKGGMVLRVQLDYELKEKLYRKLGQAQAQGKGQTQRSKEAFADQFHLPVVHGKVSFPDLRIEYANQEMEISRVDLELATGHYHAGHLAKRPAPVFKFTPGRKRSRPAPRARRPRDHDRGSEFVSHALS